MKTEYLLPKLCFVGLLVAAFLVSISANAKGLTNVNFSLNWTLGPQHEEFVVAQKQGFFKRNGLNVKFHVPSASTDAVTLVANGNADFGIAYGGDVIQARSRGVPVVTVAVIQRKTPLGLITRPSEDIRSPKGLEGKTIGLTPVPNNRAMFNAFVKKTGIDKSSLKIVTVQFNGPQLLAIGRVDAVDAISFYEPGVYRQITGNQPNFISFTKNGVPQGYFFTIISSKQTLKSHPNTVRSFLKAVLEAEKWTIENPKKARHILLNNVDGVTKGFTIQARAAIDPLVHDKTTEKKGIGWSSLKVWQEMISFYESQGLIKDGTVNPRNVYTNKFLPATAINISR